MAESMFAVANKRLSPSESPEWLERIAIIAARQGDTEDAMRIWRRTANCNLRTSRLVDELSELGLRDEIRAYYDAVRRRLPTAQLDGIVD